MVPASLLTAHSAAVFSGLLFSVRPAAAVMDRAVIVGADSYGRLPDPLDEVDDDDDDEIDEDGDVFNDPVEQEADHQEGCASGELCFACWVCIW